MSLVEVGVLNDHVEWPTHCHHPHPFRASHRQMSTSAWLRCIQMDYLILVSLCESWLWRSQRGRKVRWLNVIWVTPLNFCERAWFFFFTDMETLRHLYEEVLQIDWLVFKLSQSNLIFMTVLIQKCWSTEYQVWSHRGGNERPMGTFLRDKNILRYTQTHTIFPAPTILLQLHSYLLVKNYTLHLLVCHNDM